MSKEKIFIFDTTLRDGAQTEGVDFSVDDKVKIAKRLNEIGVDYIKVVGLELIQLTPNILTPLNN